MKTIPADERWALLRRLLHDDQLDPVIRFSGLLVLLFAQPASRIVRLTTDQIITTKDKTQILIGRKPLDLPPPLDDLAQQLVERRRGHALLGHTDDHQWLISGGAPGQALTEGALLLRLRPLGILTRPARNTAMMDLAGQLPAAVLSQLLGLSDPTAAEWVQEAGAYRAAYAADIARRSDAQVRSNETPNTHSRADGRGGE
ncbi:hypothetical protein [Saccharopolyspora shandongensis]|uniref:hypothetical protein n=1 Tax=Saccharopolyspora shandongensis TaxID=418495 RepID=UPI0033F9AB29